MRRTMVPRTLQRRIVRRKRLVVGLGLYGRMVDIMNCVAKYLRGNRSSFGGSQVISGGDFFQLPPVVVDDEEGKAMSPSLVDWAFESGKRTKEKAVSAALLTRVFRQSTPRRVRSSTRRTSTSAVSLVQTKRMWP